MFTFLGAFDLLMVSCKATGGVMNEGCFTMVGLGVSIDRTPKLQSEKNRHSKGANTTTEEDFPMFNPLPHHATF